MKSTGRHGINVVSHQNSFYLFRESPDETFVEMVDVSVLQTLSVTAADGKYSTIIL
jgi:hypothetical protein